MERKQQIIQLIKKADHTQLICIYRFIKALVKKLSTYFYLQQRYLQSSAEDSIPALTSGKVPG